MVPFGQSLPYTGKSSFDLRAHLRRAIEENIPFYTRASGHMVTLNLTGKRITKR